MSDDQEKPTTNITQRHVDDFNALVSGEYTNFALFSCFCNGEPTAAIVALQKDEDKPGMVNIYPLFIAITPGMKLVNHEGEQI